MPSLRAFFKRRGLTTAPASVLAVGSGGSSGLYLSSPGDKYLNTLSGERKRLPKKKCRAIWPFFFESVEPPDLRGRGSMQMLK